MDKVSTANVEISCGKFVAHVTSSRPVYGGQRLEFACLQPLKVLHEGALHHAHIGVTFRSRGQYVGQQHIRSNRSRLHINIHNIPLTPEMLEIAQQYEAEVEALSYEAYALVNGD